MDVWDRKPRFGDGTARSGGSLYHLSFRSGSRAGGASARSAYEYVTRLDTYDDPDLDPAIYTESDHMPSWAEDDPAEYWEAADLYERANGLEAERQAVVNHGLPDEPEREPHDYSQSHGSDRGGDQSWER